MAPSADAPAGVRLDRSDAGLVVLAVAFAFAVKWLVPLPSSLWIDELGTFWVISDGLAQTAERAWQFHGQTPLYYASLWMWSAVFGTSEVALRSLSLLCMTGAGLLLFRLCDRWFGRAAAILTVAAFVIVPTIAIHAIDARPYAMAMLAVMAATAALDRWVDRPGPGRAALYGLMAAIVVYVHYVVATVLVGHLVFVLWVALQPDRPRRVARDVAVAAITFAAALAPTIPQVAALLARQDELTFASSVPIAGVLEVWAEAVLIVVFAVSVAWHLTRPVRSIAPVPRTPMVLVAASAIAPPITLLLLSMGAGVTLWAERYWLVSLPFVVTAFGALTSRFITTPRQLTRVVVAVVALGILTTTRLTHSVEDWAAATAHVNGVIEDDAAPILFFPNLIELTNPEYLSTPINRDYVSAAVTYYPVRGSVEILPAPSPQQSNPVSVIPTLADAADRSNELVLLVNRTNGLAHLTFATGWLTGQGWTTESAESFGEVRVTRFTR